ncbi:MAG: nucleotide exchange factor GrpE [Buchnera aphidicola (Brevicoryne brassicae)]|uniref:Protein GrpE n=1 Tax=Buchnera aphidicola (Brevicoryne brassicae) TaxID=911343 RepID=A0AAJ5TXH0_9GAMM|nr:nucleotide exchange factor GrpE [Buchnera aphidicola]QCI19761.1 nucleotide exchange factor GrpE [Buchnera aphidicola (Brevicoryne brassicae)]WAI19131.1 MAG: nucleotide exchange factor GrpE [Buchnera aphidicola (Brevicoryne brassicae)]
MDNKEKKINDKKIEQKEKNIEDTNKKINNLKLQISENKKKINDIELRKLANIENIKKSSEEKKNIIKKIKTEQFLKKIIPMIDSLEDILKISNKFHSKNEPLVEGIQLTLKSLLNILSKLGVKIEGQEKELFNSDIHEAVSIESSTKIPPNHIISVNEKGFTLEKSLLRKAKVIVSKD